MRTKIKSLLTQQSLLCESQETVRVKGWVRSVRKQKKLAFLDIYDGSCLQGLQAILTDEYSDSFDRISLSDRLFPSCCLTRCRISTGTSVDLTGTLVTSSGGKQSIELQAKSLLIIGDCPAETYPLQKKRHR
jgi:asparaginyl-tRNA synthetase